MRLRLRLSPLGIKFWDWDLDFWIEYQILRLRLRLWYLGLNVWDWDWDQISIKFWDWDFGLWARTTGWLKKTQEFSHITRTFVACEPCHRNTNSFFPLETEIHTQILHTEPFLCNFLGSRYQQNKMGFSKICQCDKLITF